MLLVQACVSELGSDAAFLYVGVGDRAFWKDPNCVFRTDKDILLKWLVIFLLHPQILQRAKIMGTCTYFSSNFTTSVIIRIIKSKAKIFKFDVKLFLIKREDFFRAIRNNFTFYTTCWRSVNLGFAVC
jgi:hypothetical protein